MEITYGVVRLDEGVVASNDVDVLVLHAVAMSAAAELGIELRDSRIAEDDTTNAAEAVDADLSAIVSVLFPSISLLKKQAAPP